MPRCACHLVLPSYKWALAAALIETKECSQTLPPIPLPPPRCRSLFSSAMERASGTCRTGSLAGTTFNFGEKRTGPEESSSSHVHENANRPLHMPAPHSARVCDTTRAALAASSASHRLTGIELGCRVVTAVPSTLHVARLLSTCHIARPIWLFCLFILRFSPSLLSPFLLFGTPAHSEHGVKEAGIAGERLKASGLQPTKLHTSLQTRACRTANIALEVLDRLWIPVNRAWHLPTHCNPP